MAGSRIYVEETIYDKFIELYKAKVETVKIGSFLTDGELGPLINKL